MAKLGIAFRLACTAAAFAFAGVAAAEPASLDTYGGLPGIEQMSISPNGKGIAAVGRVAGERRLMVIGPDHAVRTTAPLANTKLRDMRWIGDDMVMAVTSVTEVLGMGFTADKIETFGAIVINADDGKAARVFSGRDSMAQAIFGDFGSRQVGGKWFGYSAASN